MNENLSSCLQFVSGFGPWKANFILEILRKEMKEGISNKNELKNFLTPNLWNNSIAFLWINEDILTSEIDANKFNGFDFLRIHPSE